MISASTVKPCPDESAVMDKDALAARYKRVRAAFLLRDSSLHAWCASNGIAMPNARAAMLQEWNGPRAKEVVRQIIRDAEIQEAV